MTIVQCESSGQETVLHLTDRKTIVGISRASGAAQDLKTYLKGARTRILISGSLVFVNESAEDVATKESSLGNAQASFALAGLGGAKAKSAVRPLMV